MWCCQYRDCTLRTAALFIISQRGHYTVDLNQFLLSLFAYGRETGKLMWEFLMKNTYWQKIIYLKTYYCLWPQKRNTMHKITWDEEAKSSFSQGSSATVCLSLVLLLQMDHTIWYQMDIVEAGSIYMQNLSNQQSSCIFNPAGLFDITMINYLSATQLTGLNQGMLLQPSHRSLIVFLWKVYLWNSNTIRVPVSLFKEMMREYLRTCVSWFGLTHLIN